MEDNIYNYGFDKSLNKDSVVNPAFNDSFIGSYDTQPLVLEKNAAGGIQNIFSVIPSGENEGDVKIGDYDGNQGFLYDKSANNIIFKGTITGGMLQTATSGQRLVIDGASNSLFLYRSGTNASFSLGSAFSTTVFLSKVFSDETGKRAGYIANEGTGLGLELSCTNASNDYPVLKIQQDGDGCQLRLNSLSATPATNGGDIVGDLAVVTGKLKICTVAGSPGTYSNVGLADSEILRVKKLLIVPELVRVNDTTTETVIFSATIPANTLINNNAVRVRLYVDNFSKATGGTDTIKLNYGEPGGPYTTVVTITQAPAAVADRKGYIEAVLMATTSGGVTTQEGRLGIDVATGGDVTNAQRWYQIIRGTSSEDETTDLSIMITFQFGTANVGNLLDIYHAEAEIIT